MQLATEKDLYYCYRLLLNREPDEAGETAYLNLIRYHHISLQTLVDYFLYSEEFQQLQAEAKRPRSVQLGDFEMYVRLNDFIIGAVIAREKHYEPHVTGELRRLLKAGMVFVDVGANIGYFTMLAASLVGPGGKVIAFEPNEDNCDLVRRSTQANGFTTVELHPNAVAEKAQIFRLVVDGRTSNGRVIDSDAQAFVGINAPRYVQAVDPIMSWPLRNASTS